MTSGHAPQTGANGGEDRGPVRTDTPFTDAIRAMTQTELAELIAASKLRDQLTTPVGCRAVHIEPDNVADMWPADVVFRCDLDEGHDGAHHQTTPPAMFGMWQGADGG